MPGRGPHPRFNLEQVFSMWSGIAAGLGAGALWGFSFLAPRVLAGFAALDVSAARFIVYGLTALLMMAWRFAPSRLPNWRHALAALALSVIGFTGYYLLVVLSIRRLGVALPTLIMGTVPIWVMLLGKPQSLRWAALLPGLALTAAGLWLMGLHGAQSAAGGRLDASGLALACAGLASWTAFALLNAAWLKRHPDVSARDWANWLGVATGLGGALMWLAAGTPAAQLAATPGLGVFLLMAVVIGFGASWLSTVLWNVASQRLPASLCGQLIVSETLFALAYDALWSQAWPGGMQLAAAALFALGIVAAIRAHG